MKESELIIGLMASFRKKKYAFADLAHLVHPFKVSEGNLRTQLSRLAKKGNIEIEKVGREAFYSFSKRSNANTKNVAYSFKSPHWLHWKDTWWGITYTLPSTANNERYRIVKKMTAYRFALLHGGFWIRPYNKLENIEDVFSQPEFQPYLKLIRFQTTKPFTSSEVQKLWDIQTVHAMLQQTYIYIKNRITELEKITPERAMVEKMETGAIIVEALFNDPLLPEMYLPKDWKGEEVRQLFSQWDNKVTEISKPYWSKIYNQNENY